MGQITRCPSCGTMFKVVPDQLKISDGWVRCGHCAEVFDAPLNLQPAALAAPPVPAAVSPDPVQPVPLPQVNVPMDITPTAETRPTGAAVVVDPDVQAGHLAVHGGDDAVLAATVPDAPPAQTWTTEPEPVVDVVSLSTAPELPAEDREEKPHDRGILVTTTPQADRLAPPRTTEASVEVSFMREARRRAFWRRPMVRLGLATLGLALAATLLLQVLVDRRDQLAAARPDLRPALDVLCQLAACSIQPWRQIDALVIDGSSFSWLAPNVYRLALSVKNVAALDVAKPSIELTLTDVRERALLRRVLTPAELGAAATTIKAGGEWVGTATVQLAASVVGVAGYRVLAFYP